MGIRHAVEAGLFGRGGQGAALTELQGRGVDGHGVLLGLWEPLEQAPVRLQRNPIRPLRIFQGASFRKKGAVAAPPAVCKGFRDRFSAANERQMKLI
ncbi:hypothetical protein BOSEA31B_10262 [Hyphomicrobiales bacterium]|nr:hypothetical protein BOSEA31B_10262 [Hyphomicrobiales bacterium]CAH1701941.1 hypothetical protein BOSEA1005_21640 [Hyphomicrobiales bacterium]CAI0346098.1 hypothetical protein BO1005MUT1_470256 [Hyphomicrobiales bacterium]